MRTLFLAFLIALLPLRGWIGDAMALDLAGPHHAAVTAAANTTAGLPDCHTGHTGHGGHGGHADMSTTDSPDPAQADGDCGSCSLCQICHSVVLASALPPLPSLQLGAAAPLARQPLYASAERLPGDKPPKS